METWVIVVVIFLAIGAIIGNLSMLKRSAHPMRRKSLNDLEETLPRSGDRRKEQMEKQRKQRQENR
ncbi:DUF2897 family protein [Thalassotalea crassostreae]|uniref:DUF2897 family protein n=1 Tax=Thalassotalea crassostreae TaxID=1763536 RepID=UPI000838F8BD|nr:DUF2897 family protein [Thalassotalea crassostreae]